MKKQIEILEEIATVLRNAFSEAPGASVVVEDLCNPSAELDKALGKFGVTAMIAASGHRRKSNTGAVTAGELGISIIVIENPKRNRLTEGRPTVSTVSELIRDALHWRVIGESRLLYVAMDRADVDENDYRMDISFIAEPTATVGSLVWGLSDGTQAYGEIVSKRTGRGGEAQFEPGRDGRARFMGVRDPHLTVDLTANVTDEADSFPEIGSAFSCPIGGETVTFQCTVSEISESMENGKTIHLSGRTV